MTNTPPQYAFQADCPMAAGYYLSLLSFLTVVCLLYGVSCTDPGILPRREIVLQTGQRERLKKILGYDLLGGRAEGRWKSVSARLVNQVAARRRHGREHGTLLVHQQLFLKLLVVLV